MRVSPLESQKCNTAIDRRLDYLLIPALMSMDSANEVHLAIMSKRSKLVYLRLQ